MDEPRRPVLSHPFVTRAARWGVVSWSLIGLSVLAYFAYRYVLYPIRIVFPPLVVALIVVYLLNPIVSMLERRGLSRLLGALLTYLLFLTAVGLALRFLIPTLAGQVSSFAKTVPDLLSRAQAWLADIGQRFGIHISGSDFVASIGPQGSGGEFIKRIFSFTAGVLHVALILVLGPVLAFYILVDLPKIQRSLQALIPARRQPEIRSLLERMGRALGGFFRGQLLVALFVALASMLGLFIVGLPYWGLVGLIAGLFNLIPLVGPFIGAVPALFIAFTTQSSEGLLHLTPGLPLALGASAALLFVQQLDNHIISPNVVARTVRLHPVTVMLGLLIGGTLLGLWGMLLAVPTIAAAKILLLHYWDTRLQWPPPLSSEETGPSPPAARAGPIDPAESTPPVRFPAGPGTAGNRPTPPVGAEPSPPAPWVRWWRRLRGRPIRPPERPEPPTGESGLGPSRSPEPTRSR